MGTADQRVQLVLELAKIGFLVEGGSTGFRIELAVKGPKELARAVRPVGEIEEISPDLATTAVQRQGAAADPARALRGFRAIVEDPAPCVSIGSEKVVVCYAGELARHKGELPVLIDDLQGKPLSLGYHSCRADVLVARRTIHIDPRPDTVTAQHCQDEARIISAR